MIRKTPLKRKPCKQEGCTQYPIIGGQGFCYQHALKKEKKEDSNGDLLNSWFLFHMKFSKRVCENCDADLSRYNESDWRGSQHHIIEKSKINGCPSVATDIRNHGVLGKWCCHSQWHTSYENAKKMPFFKIAKARFKQFEEDILERRKIPQVFLED